MNQIRNLITTNLFSLLMLWGIIKLVSLIGDNALIIIFGIFLILIITVATMAFYAKVLSYEDYYDFPPIIAPVPLFITLFLGFAYLLGKIKIVKSNNYKVCSYYNHGSIYIFYFDLFKIQVLDEMYFNGTPSETEKLVDLIDKHYNYGLVGNKFNFRYWDGMLDDAARRKDTIDNIKNS